MDDQFERLFLSEIGEFLKHLIGGFEIKGRLVVGVIKAHPRHQDGAEDRILRDEEVDIPGGADRLFELIAHSHDGPVEIAQLLHIFAASGSHQECIVAGRLHLEEVVKPGDVEQFIPLLAVEK